MNVEPENVPPIKFKRPGPDVVMPPGKKRNECHDKQVQEGPFWRRALSAKCPAFCSPGHHPGDDERDGHLPAGQAGFWRLKSAEPRRRLPVRRQVEVGPS